MRDLLFTHVHVGSSAIHETCLIRWVEESGKTKCEICKETLLCRKHLVVT